MPQAGPLPGKRYWIKSSTSSLKFTFLGVHNISNIMGDVNSSGDFVEITFEYKENKFYLNYSKRGNFYVNGVELRLSGLYNFIDQIINGNKSLVLTSKDYPTHSTHPRMVDAMTFYSGRVAKEDDSVGETHHICIGADVLDDEFSTMWSGKFRLIFFPEEYLSSITEAETQRLHSLLRQSRKN